MARRTDGGGEYCVWFDAEIVSEVATDQTAPSFIRTHTTELPIYSSLVMYKARQQYSYLAQSVTSISLLAIATAASRNFAQQKLD